jgi:putative flippase GtrA
MTSRAAQFAAVYAALTASHEVADHWVQRDKEAVAKGKPDAAGARACAVHVATYTATQAAALYAVQRATGMRLSWRRAALGLAVSTVTHYVADRQGGHWRDENPRGVVRLAAVTGHAGWLARDPNAGYLMDQAWHKGWIAVAAAVVAGGGQ